VRIVHQYSHLNGWEFLQVHHKKLWNEFINVIQNIDGERCRTKVSKEKRKIGRGKLLSPKALNRCFLRELKTKQWQPRQVRYWVTDNVELIRQTLHKTPAEQKVDIESAGHKAITSYNQTDFVRNKVAVEVQFGKYAFVAYDLFVKHLAFYVQGEIDVGIEVLPTKTMQQQMSSGIAYYEGELYNVIRNGRGVPAVPLVLLGVEP